MGFTSLTFGAFFAVVFALYWLAGRKQAQNVILLIASYVFYGWLNPWYTLLLGFSTTADYFLALGITRYKKDAQIFFSLSLLLNLGALAFFKYYNFFNNALAAGLHTDFFLVSIALPAGLSFYTLKKLSYMLDVSRGTYKPVEDFVSFALFVSFFPQLISGPIDRAQKLIPQIESDHKWQAARLGEALPLIVMGLFKKIVVADTLNSIVGRVFSLSEPSKLLVLAATLGFTLQILADFSAYTDLSRGLAFLLGFETSENFRRPYLALTPSEFWNRWHITLSNFLRDYIFFPLRRALLKRKTLPGWLVQSVPPLVTMFVSGLWHGAGWTYLLWGIYYGLLIIAYQSAGIHGDWKMLGGVKRLGAWVLMFGFIVFGWLLFRAPSLGWLSQALFSFPWLGTSQDWVIILVVLAMTLAYAAPLWLKALLDHITAPDSWWQAVYLAALVMVTVLYVNSSNPDFIYFQF